MNWGDWAATVDLSPAPISYKVYPIADLIPSTWVNSKGDNISALWQNALRRTRLMCFQDQKLVI